MTADSRVRHVRKTLTGALLGGISFLAVLAASGHAPVQDAPEVASLSLSCKPAEQGVRCRLLALFRDVSRSPRDITAEALWQLSGVAGVQISPVGAVDAPTDGDVTIEAHFRGLRARAHARLVRNHAGQLLARVHGRVYVETTGGLRAVPRARVEVVRGQNAGVSTMTRDDGGYELAGLVPGEVTIHAVMLGYAAVELSGAVEVGENCLNVLIDPLPPLAGRASRLPARPDGCDQDPAVRACA